MNSENEREREMALLGWPSQCKRDVNAKKTEIPAYIKILKRYCSHRNASTEMKSCEGGLVATCNFLAYA